MLLSHFVTICEKISSMPELHNTLSYLQCSQTNHLSKQTLEKARRMLAFCLTKVTCAGKMFGFYSSSLSLLCQVEKKIFVRSQTKSKRPRANTIIKKIRYSNCLPQMTDFSQIGRRILEHFALTHCNSWHLAQQNALIKQAQIQPEF